MREEGIDNLEVHVDGICFDGDNVLIGKRSLVRKIYPGLWAGGGGQVRKGENFEEAITRQLKQEFRVIAKPIRVLGVYEIQTPSSDQKKIPGVKFLCEIESFVNGEGPVINEEFDEWRWQPINKIDELDFIPGLKEHIKRAHSLFKSIKK
jgi:8-oxo-dGTP pyrophosphatase MutT (NUDIX family)